MKRIVFILAALISSNAFALPGIHEALKNPSSISVLNLTGEKDEATLLTKNANKFSTLKQISISNISDSVLLEQDIIAVAACSNVHELNISNCNMKNLSGAMRMLVAVNNVGISNCKKLSSDQAFSILAQMPSLKILNYQTNELKELPSAFFNMRGMNKISIRNNDLSLADGYALNNSSPAALLVSDSLVLGFGKDKLVLQYTCYDKTSLQSHISIMRDLLQGAVGVEGKMTLPQRAVAFNRVNDLVHPPIEGLDVRKNIYTTDAATGGLVEYPSGTKIIIPSHAFVDANGNEVKGDVTIDYREFRDPVDILVSGIPMQYDSAGEVGDFESAGMFDINASQNGKEVFLAPDKKVDLEFAVVDTASTFNFYKLDSQQGWVYQSQTGKVEQKDVVVAPQTPFSLSVAVQKYKELTLKVLGKRPSLGDTVTFDNRYADTNYVYMNKQIRYNAARKKQVRQASNWSFRRYAGGKDNVCCMMNRVNYLSDVDPEMQPFTGVMLQILDPISRSDFKKYLGRSAGITDMRMEYDGGTTFTMELKYLWGFKTFTVSPVKILDKKPVAYSEKNCATMFRNYSKSLLRRKKRLDRSIGIHFKRFHNWEKVASKDSMVYWQHLNPQMNAQEKPMNFQNWLGYIKDQNNIFDSLNGTKGLAQSDAVYQALSIAGFGIFNCDQVKRLHHPITVMAKVLSQLGAILMSTHFYVIANNRNMVLSYYNFGEDSKGIKMSYGAEDKNKLLAIAPDGSLSYTDEVSFTRMQKLSGGTGFPSVQIETRPVTAQELRDIIYPPVEQK